MPSSFQEVSCTLTPRTAYMERLRGVGRDAPELIHFIDMSCFRTQFSNQRGNRVDPLTFVSMMQKALKPNRAVRQRLLHKADAAVPAAISVRQHSQSQEIPFLPSKSNSSLVRKQLSSSHPGNVGDLKPESDEMVARLIYLFHAIDLDGDGFISLDEFTRFILDKAMHFSATGFSSFEGAILPYKHQPPSLGRYRHKGHIDRVVAIRRKGYLAVIEQGSLDIYVYMAKTGRILTTMRAHSPILCTTYIEPLHHLVTSHADKTLVMWNLDDAKLRERWQERCRWPVPCAQISLTYVDSQSLLYTGTSTGSIYTWDLVTMENKGCLHGHTDTVYAILSLDQLGMIATASKDATICIWDAYSSRQRLRLAGHKKGVFSLAYSQVYRLLFSAGFDHEVCVWSPLVGTLVHRLQGHACPMVSVCAVEDRPEVVTADSSGTVKLWDLRSFRCVQTLSKDHESELHGLTDVTYIHLNLPSTNQRRTRFVVATKQLFFIDQVCAVRTEPVTDDVPVAAALYNDVMLTIITGAGPNIKVWDAFLGTLKANYVEKSKGDISALCLDHRKRKIISGDTLGVIQFFDHETGALMKTCPTRGLRGGSHEAVVQVIHMGHKTNQLIGAFSDGVICIYDESRVHDCPLLMEFDQNQRNLPDLISVVLSSSTTYVASASSQLGDPIRLWNHTTAKCEVVLDPDVDSYTVLSLSFLNPIPLLVAGCSDGVFRVWSVSLRGSQQLGRRTCLFHWKNVQPNYFVLVDEGQQKGACDTGPSQGSFLRWSRGCSSARDPSNSCSSSSRVAFSITDSQALQSKKTITPRSSAAISPRSSPRSAATVPSVSTLKKGSPRSRIESEQEAPASRGAGIVCVIWHAESSTLYSGDESGCIRAWNLQAVFNRLYPRTAGGGQRFSVVDPFRPGNSAGGGRPLSADGGGNLKDLVNLEWSLQAHEDAVLSLQLTNEPKGLLSASADLCTQMWTLQGRSVGTLVQGLSLGTKSPQWDLPLEVTEREKKEIDEIQRISSGVKARSENGDRRRSVARKSVAISQETTTSLSASAAAAAVVASPRSGRRTSEAEGTTSNASLAATNVSSVLSSNNMPMLSTIRPHVFQQGSSMGSTTTSTKSLFSSKDLGSTKLQLTSRSSTLLHQFGINHQRHLSRSSTWLSMGLTTPKTAKISKHDTIMKVLETMREDPTLKHDHGSLLETTKGWNAEGGGLGGSADDERSGRLQRRGRRRKQSAQMMMSKMKMLRNSVNLPNFDPDSGAVEFWVRTRKDGEGKGGDDNEEEEEDGEDVAPWTKQAQPQRPTSSAKDIPMLTTTYKKLQGAAMSVLLPPTPGRRSTVYAISDKIDTKLEKLKMTIGRMGGGGGTTARKDTGRSNNNDARWAVPDEPVSSSEAFYQPYVVTMVNLHG